MIALERRKLVRALAAVLATLVTLAGVWKAIGLLAGGDASPGLYEGDRIETTDCRVCHGRGYQQQGFEPVRCRFCLGRGEVQVIQPGPERPTLVFGLVVDRDRLQNPIGFFPERMRVPPTTPAEAFAIGRAILTFRKQTGESITVRASATGRFSFRLEPGSWTVYVSAPGFRTFRAPRKLVVEPLTGAAWVLPMATGGLTPSLDDDLLDDEEIRSTRGLCLLAGLSSRDERRGFLRTYLRKPKE